jgi:hypothetical protein
MQAMRFLTAKILQGIALSLIFLVPWGTASGYSVLTHEEIVDLLWNDQFQPLLLAQYPNATPDEMKEAHAYAYGGSLLPDMGYYPFGNKYFSDLLHYVRSGDFVEALIDQSSSLDEYAFALGALAHYASDNSGHPTINQVVAIEFPKLREKYGSEVTYTDDPKAHIRTEFGFDMVQVAKNRYTSDRYHDFIGFKVAKPLVERAFQQTYGIPMQSVIHNEDLAIGTFRRAVSKIIPEMTRVALVSRHKEIVQETPNFNKKEFLYHLSRASYHNEWGRDYREPGAGTRILAFFLKIVPKVGPFRALNFQIPSKKTEDMYIKSVNKSVTDYGGLLREERTGKLQLTNLDCDTGRPARFGEYSLADKTYGRLLDDLAKKNFDQASAALRTNILTFYDGAHPTVVAKNTQKSWEATQVDLDKLRSSELEAPMGILNPVQNLP